MNWQSTIDGLFLIGSWMAGSMLVAMLCIWIIQRYFPPNPDAEYTYVLKNTSGERTTVVLPPGLPESTRREVLNQAYRRLGVEPESGQ
jgi:hypothetical protein